MSIAPLNQKDFYLAFDLIKEITRVSLQAFRDKKEWSTIKAYVHGKVHRDEISLLLGAFSTDADPTDEIELVDRISPIAQKVVVNYLTRLRSREHESA